MPDDDLDLDINLPDSPPASAIAGDYNPEESRAYYKRTRVIRAEQYEYEKFTGARLSTGVKPLKRLGPRHRQILSKFLAGEKVMDIALDLDLDGLTVYRIINDPLIQKLIAEWCDGVDSELEALMPAAVDVVRRALNDGDVKVALLGVDRLAKMRSKGPDGVGKSKELDAVNQTRASASKALAKIQAKVMIRREATVPLSGPGTEQPEEEIGVAISVEVENA